MKKLMLTGLLLAASAPMFAQGGGFYIGGSWGRVAPAPVRVYAPPPPPPAYYGGYGYNVYRRPPMPGPGFVWIDGYYNWAPRGGYAWRPGYWAARPHPRAYWVAPRYHRGGYIGGYWRR
ncbi:hypothetical protein F183_A53980 [Bryobacterales bacterium F-183]|nr:hypothetical protein F183_A53980 [Bryobacterales bacterium F-183]